MFHQLLKAAILERYPAKITILFYYYFFGTIQCALLTLIVGEDSSIWAVTPDIELISVLYSVSTTFSQSPFPKCGHTMTSFLAFKFSHLLT